MYLFQLSTGGVAQSYSHYAYPSLLAAALLAYGADMAQRDEVRRHKPLHLTDATAISTSSIDTVQESYHAYRDIPAANEGEVLLTLKSLYEQFSSSKPAAITAFYTTKDDSHVADFLCEGSRITCVVREKYAHIMSFIGATFTDKTFENENYAPHAVASLAEKLLNTLPLR